MAVELHTLALGLDARPMVAGATEAERALVRVGQESERMGQKIVKSERESVAALTGLSTDLKDVHRDFDQLSTRFDSVASDAVVADRNVAKIGDTLARVGRQAQATAEQLSTLSGLQGLGGYGLTGSGSGPSFANGGYGSLAAVAGLQQARATAEQLSTLRSLQNNGGYGGTSPDVESALDGIGAKAGIATTALSGLKTQLLTTFGAFAGTQAIIEATKAIGGFEKQVKQIAVIGGLSESSDEFKTLVETAREIGRATQFSAKEAAGGLLDLTKAGLGATEAVSAIRPAIDLAVAGDVTLGRSSEILLATMAQFGKEAKDAGEIADVLFKQSVESQASVDGLAQGLSVVGPLASKVGLSLEGTAAILGTLNDSAIKSSEAGTALRTVLSALSQPTADTELAVAALGLTLEDINPRSRSLVDIFEKLQQAGLDTGTAFQLFGTYGATAGLVIAQNVEKLKDYEKTLQGAKGSTSEAAGAVGDTLVG